MLVEDVVHHDFCGRRKHQASNAIEHHQEKTE